MSEKHHVWLRLALNYNRQREQSDMLITVLMIILWKDTQLNVRKVNKGHRMMSAPEFGRGRGWRMSEVLANDSRVKTFIHPWKDRVPGNFIMQMSMSAPVPALMVKRRQKRNMACRTHPG